MSLSIHEGASYDEIFPLGCKPEEDSPRSLEREPSTQSLSDENEEKDEGNGEEDEYGEDEGD